MQVALVRGDTTRFGLGDAIRDVAYACGVSSVIRYARRLRDDPRAEARELARYQPPKEA